MFVTMPPLIIYSPNDSPRLRYVLDWIFTERLEIAYRLVHRLSDEVMVGYGASVENGISIPDGGMLWQTSIPDKPSVTGWDNPQQSGFSFDVFGAVFYLLARCEEYEPFQPDRHGRFSPQQSILFQNAWLERPLVDEWIAQLRILLVEKFKLNLPEPKFSLRLSYDIDIAYSYLHKGFKRTLGGVFKDLSAGHFKNANQRLRVLSGKNGDPYDSFLFLQKLHAEHRIMPHYFILAAQQTTDWDKNIHPNHPSMKALALQLSAAGTVGMHPSYYSQEKTGIFEAEKKGLEQISHSFITNSRQHFIRLFLPHTYRMLLKQGIHHDWSMGYSPHIGFRAGTSHDFFWYDLEQEEQTTLRIHPFCFMDTTAHYDMGLSVTDAFYRLRQIRKRLEKTGGVLTTVFHNFSLGTDTEWEGWQPAYADFVAETISGYTP